MDKSMGAMFPKWIVFLNDSLTTVDDVAAAIERNNIQGLRIHSPIGFDNRKAPTLVLNDTSYLPMRNGGAIGYNPELPGQFYIARGEAHLLYPLISLGFASDYTPSFNVKQNAPQLMNAYTFQATVDDRKDLVWLCNQLGKLFQRELKHVERTYRFRLCLAVDTQPTPDYVKKMGPGASSGFDNHFINPATGRMYWMGFDYDY